MFVSKVGRHGALIVITGYSYRWHLLETWTFSRRLRASSTNQKMYQGSQRFDPTILHG